jgi:hypothetical protein
MPTRPKLATAEAGQVDYDTFDSIMEEAQRGVTPYRILLPGDEEPTEIPCPSGRQMKAFGVATRMLDDDAAALALFGEYGPRFIELTEDLPFYVRAQLLAKLMGHYGIQVGNQLPE